ncbi:MAG: glycosyltransferase family 2 protein [candidate division KSB1 bacterium]|nr:glycosyltransferase family 2 protein [candidate division KSB1 bacterium]
MIDLSIIIVNWNTKEHLARCLDSIFQNWPSHQTEIIVVDNGSTDGSADMVKNNYPEVKLIANYQNLGFARANNIGINHSSGRFLCLLNSDTQVLDECFDRMINYMEIHPEIGILGPKILNPDLNVQRSCMAFPTLWNSLCRALALDSFVPRSKLFGGYLMTYFAHDSIRSVDIINGCCWLVRKEALDTVGLLDEQFFMYGEDMDWCRRFHQAGWQVVFYPEAQVVHYGGASSAQLPVKFYIEMRRANLLYTKKHHGKIFYLLVLVTFWLHEIARIIGRVCQFLIMPSQKKEISFYIKRSRSALRYLLAQFSSSIHPSTGVNGESQLISIGD